MRGRSAEHQQPHGADRGDPGAGAFSRGRGDRDALRQPVRGEVGHGMDPRLEAQGLAHHHRPGEERRADAAPRRTGGAARRALGLGQGPFRRGRQRARRPAGGARQAPGPRAAAAGRHRAGQDAHDDAGPIPGSRRAARGARAARTSIPVDGALVFASRGRPSRPAPRRRPMPTRCCASRSISGPRGWRSCARRRPASCRRRNAARFDGRSILKGGADGQPPDAKSAAIVSPTRDLILRCDRREPRRRAPDVSVISGALLRGR